MKRDNLGRPDDVTATQPISLDVLREKYLKAGETGVEDLYRRVAKALASVEAEPLRAKYEALFLDNLRAGAIGAGRIMSAAGTGIQATLINCFVQPVGGREHSFMSQQDLERAINDGRDLTGPTRTVRFVLAARGSHFCANGNISSQCLSPGGFEVRFTPKG